jgi:hypothetical protein
MEIEGVQYAQAKLNAMVVSSIMFEGRENSSCNFCLNVLSFFRGMVRKRPTSKDYEMVQGNNHAVLKTNWQTRLLVVAFVLLASWCQRRSQPLDKYKGCQVYKQGILAVWLLGFMLIASYWYPSCRVVFVA